jgi:hypothetical protein
VTWPTPQPGLVIRYSYLWKREADAGREEGVKDRPCAVVIAFEGSASERRVIVLPITHSPPYPPDEGIALPQATKARLGLDGDQSWVIVSEANDFAWPGPDLRFPPGQGPEDAAYGFLPPAVFRVVRDRFVARYKRRTASLVNRSE